MQIIINAGGVGTRLWPLSTAKRPKQFVGLVDEETLLYKTYKRLVKKYSPSQIWVNTNEKFKNLVIESLPSSFDESHILTEPSRRDNFAAICSHAGIVAHRTSPNEPLVFVHADHFIPEKDWDTWNDSLELLANSTAKYELLTAGIKPTFASTQFGYIQLLAKDKQKIYTTACDIQKFKEKPDLELAEEFVNSGEYIWNLGYFSFTYNNLQTNLQKFWPIEAGIVQDFYKKGEISTSSYNKMTKIAFDYALAEKMDKIGVIGMDISWEDLGTWDTIIKHLPKLGKKQVEFAGHSNVVKLKNNNKKVAFVGVAGLLLVESEEGILIIDPKNSGDVKKVAQYFEEN
jgi:mannose-1-phosphate guanylyltransferase